MSDRPSLRLSRIARTGLIATSLVGSLAFGGGSMVALAQDASPEASPMGECIPGELSTGTVDMATPMAGEATPAPVEAPVGTPADEATTAAATDAVNNIVACSADPASIATLVTVNLVATHPFGGFASIEDAMAGGFFEGVPYAAGVTVGNVVTYEDGSIGVEVTYNQSQYQVVGEEMNLVDEGGTWKLNAVSPAPVELDGDAAAVGVQLGENEDGTYFITPNVTSIGATDILILQATNAGVEPHELVVLQLPEGVDPMGLLDGTVAEDDVVFIGQVSVNETGDLAELTLVGLPAGQYTMVCFFPNADGEPHAAHGMIAPFEVTAPAE